jgi:hypothetical protein
MASDKFEYFSKLPWELRDQIWKCCIHPYEAQAHFFTFFNTSDSKEVEAISGKRLVIENAEGMSLAAPRSRRTGQLSWFDDNRSAYRYGRGLWTACWESRMVILKHYKIIRPRAPMGLWENEVLKDQNHDDDLPESTTSYFLLGGKPSYMTFSPRYDLFCLRPFKFDTIDWNQTPFKIQHPSETQGFRAQHIALEFDPSWIDEFDQDNAYGHGGTGPIEAIAQAATDKLIWAQKLWFIDYGLRRTESAKYSLEGRETFQGFGCRFVEVREYEDEWEESRIRTGAMWDDYIDDGFCPLSSRLSIFRFLSSLEKSVRRYFEQKARGYSTPQGSPASIHNRCSPIIGVLACERD